MTWYRRKYKYERGFYFTKSLYESKAFQSLTKSAQNLLWCFIIYGVHWDKKTKTPRNNGEISYSEKQFKKKFNHCSQTYINARNKLIEVGFIKQTYRGGNHKGDMATYFTFLPFKGMDKNKQRWREYPEKDWLHEKPKEKNKIVGKETQWGKGQTGRK